LADAWPRQGESMRACGYGPAGQYACVSGTVEGYSQAGAASTYDTLVITGSARDGDSGGPIFNGRGELAAVLWGSDGRTTVGTYSGRIKRIFGRWLQPGWRPSPPGPAVTPGPVEEEEEDLVPVEWHKTPCAGLAALEGLVKQNAAAIAGILARLESADRKSGDRTTEDTEDAENDDSQSIPVPAVVPPLPGGPGGRTPSSGPIAEIPAAAESPAPGLEPPASLLPSSLQPPASSLVNRALYWGLAAAASAAGLSLPAGAIWAAVIGVRGVIRWRRRARRTTEAQRARRSEEREGSAGPSSLQSTASSLVECRAEVARLRGQLTERAAAGSDAGGEGGSAAALGVGWHEGQAEARNRYVRVRETNLEGEAYKEALASWAESNPKTAGLIQAVEELARNIYHGKQVAARMEAKPDDPQIVPRGD